ncbi:MAG: hypothetical protein HGA43_06335, partial [Nitrospirae bacterium]|nr:hypothetical protein [Nitrospirota bacterium]
MIKPPHIQYEDKVVLVSILVGMGAWVLDAAIDSLVFSQAMFLDTLILEITPHELYFRLFLLLVIVLFGVMASRTLARRKFVEEELRKTLARLEDEKAKTDAVVAAI